MKKIGKLLLGVSLLIALMASAVIAQRPSTMSNQAKPEAVAPAPQTVPAKYEGGVFGYRKKQDGSLTFDDANKRLVFRDKHQKEVFSIPYDGVMMTFADTQSRRPAAASVIGSIPLPYGANIPAWFVKKKYRYLTVHYSDPDAQVAGVTSFKLQNKEILASVVATLANKAGLTPRGDIFVRRGRNMQSEIY